MRGLTPAFAMALAAYATDGPGSPYGALADA